MISLFKHNGVYNNFFFLIESHKFDMHSFVEYIYIVQLSFKNYKKLLLNICTPKNSN